MNEERRIYYVNTKYSSPTIAVFLVLKETEKLFKVKGLTEWSWDSQLHKDDGSICFSLSDARELLKKRLNNKIDGLKTEMQRVRSLLGQVDMMEPKWSKPCSPNS